MIVRISVPCRPTPGFNLSRDTSFRTLETTAESINAAYDAASSFFETVLSSVAPRTPLDVVVTVSREVDLSSGVIRKSSVLPILADMLQ